MGKRRVRRSSSPATQFLSIPILIGIAAVGWRAYAARAPSAPGSSARTAATTPSLDADWLRAPAVDLEFPRAAAGPSSAFTAAHNASMRWGTYRPGVFFGTKSRSQPEALVTGLMWHGPAASAAAIRYECTQGGHDGIGKYGWKEHDGRGFGVQDIGDESGGVALRTIFVKDDAAAARGERWAVRVAAAALATKARAAQPDDEATLAYHVAADCEYAAEPLRCDLALRVVASSPTLLRLSGVAPGRNGAPFSVTFRAIGPNARLEFASATEGHLPLDALKERVAQLLSQGRDGLPSTAAAVSARGSALVVKVSGAFPLVLEVIFDGTTGAATAARDASSGSGGLAMPLTMSGRSVEEHIAAARARLNARFLATFSGAADFSPKLLAFTKCVFAEMLGGIGFWYGSSAVAAAAGEAGGAPSAARSATKLAPRALFSATPSRPKFPRGFLWDEGFHDLVIASWDGAIARDILSHWSGLITSGGWVAREQILGVEARGRVPREFIPQHTTHANPPTLLLHLEAQIARLAANSANAGHSAGARREADEIVRWLRAVLPSLSRWFSWFVRSQRGEVEGTFRWRGRLREEGGGVSGEKLHVNTLASGLDDYPRASHPDVLERHVDLYCWVARGAAIMASASQTLAAHSATTEMNDSRGSFAAASEKGGAGDDARGGVERARWSAEAARFGALHEHLRANLDRWHWDAASGSYADFGSHIAGGDVEEHVVYRCAEATAGGGAIDVALPTGQCPPSHPRRMYPLGDGAGGMMRRPIFVAPRTATGRPARPKLGFIDRVGYVTLMPLMMRLLPPSSPKLGALLAVLNGDGKNTRLWTKYGLRSLARADLFYGQGNAPGDMPYWRGPIWMNMNYLALSGLHYYARVEGPWQPLALERYTALRKVRVSILI